MHLRRIDINGFKSFGERTVLEFAPGVTCVVGPNGSGKSNVVDAIRWVLGEQGYKGIRLEKSDDVIFLGSKGKGKMSRASVEMLLADIPAEKALGYEELAVSRHVYRDGEGEYFMNHAKVRLKDTLDILAQLHVSTKNYSIVTQGMSDQLLRFTPQELRSTLEDASGVKEWQLKKRETERKLVRTGEHTAQVQGLLAELKPYLANLRGQMRRWEKRAEYEKKVQELKETKVYVSARDIAMRKKASSEQRGRAHGLIERLEAQKKTLPAEIAEAEKRILLNGANTSATQQAAPTLEKLYEQRMQLERELIRVESQLASFASARAKSAPDMGHVRGGVSRLRVLLETLGNETSPEALKDGIRKALDAVSALEKSFDAPADSVPKEITDAQQKVRDAISGIEREIDGAKRSSRQEQLVSQQAKEELFQKERMLRRIEDELERALREEALYMESAGALSQEELECMRQAQQHVPDAPGTLEELLRVLETSYAGKSMMPKERIEEELIRANVYLSEIGDVDPQVKAEHDKVEERFAFLSKELEDVRKASVDLEKLIVDLEEEIRKKFEESFVNVNKEFSKYMETIFGGGKGELLKLAPPKKKHDEDDELSDNDDDGAEQEDEQEKEGVVVRVELPGKRIKSLELLSGGERALTSLAFLFALIASAKPPFVVLDEVDAALDEANSKRFANLLESVQAQTQCIVVTHNRSTMHAAQALYGVTMGGDGISRILSLKLEK